ncbi:pilus assembly protein TadG-related protein [Amycolatopsis sp. NPDC051061]|uniref:pilus assembly protein TadG-related protein n=1 Tax=Amycolatopsis sp. NPDC051061 TaxID=3155042 RepID=UPI0034240192
MTRHGNDGRWAAWWRAERGQLSAFVLVLLIGLLALAGLSLDGGLALASKIRAGGAAESAARAGAQGLDLTAYRATGALRLDPALARELAQRYLASIGATGTVAVAGDTVTVEVTATYRTQLLSLIGVEDIHTHGHAAAHPQRGITGEDREFANSDGSMGGN